MARVFISGGTGYLGRSLIAGLVARNHEVRALVRPGSENKLPPGIEPVFGNALDAATFTSLVAPSDTLVHLVGVPHPAPWKERQFRAVDLVSARASVAAAVQARIAHFVYLSVAHPAPVMQAYIRVRTECEELIRAASLNATILRPWYVLGPGHRWPILLKPLYRLMNKDAAMRLGLVTLEEMSAALLWSVEHPPEGIRILEVPSIRERFAYSLTSLSTH